MSISRTALRKVLTADARLPLHTHLRKAIRELRLGHLSPEEFVKMITPKTRELTTREIVGLLAGERFSQARIARAVGVSKQTVGEHVQALIATGDLDEELVRR